MIDPGTGWFEVASIKDLTSQTAVTTMDDVWFLHHPRPCKIGFDHGGKYKNVFKEMMNYYGPKRKPSYHGIPNQIVLYNKFI
jgi:hypothetical protein